MYRMFSQNNTRQHSVTLEPDNYNKLSLLALYLAGKGQRSKYNRLVSISSLLNEAISEYLDRNKDTVDHIYDMIESKVPFPQIFSGEL